MACDTRRKAHRRIVCIAEDVGRYRFWYKTNYALEAIARSGMEYEVKIEICRHCNCSNFWQRFACKVSLSLFVSMKDIDFPLIKLLLSISFHAVSALYKLIISFSIGRYLIAFEARYLIILFHIMHRKCLTHILLMRQRQGTGMGYMGLAPTYKITKERTKKEMLFTTTYHTGGSTGFTWAFAALPPGWTVLCSVMSDILDAFVGENRKYANESFSKTNKRRMVFKPLSSKSAQLINLNFRFALSLLDLYGN